VNELVEAFTTAVPFALQEMAGVVAVVRADVPVESLPAWVAARLVLTASDETWDLVLSFPEVTAALLAERVLAGTGAPATADVIRDCAGEVANVVAGHAKALLVGTPAHFTLSTPTLVGAGPASEARGAGEERVIRFDSDVGAFTVRLHRS
jgi:CheY-specific phosphatase CheX